MSAKLYTDSLSQVLSFSVSLALVCLFVLFILAVATLATHRERGLEREREMSTADAIQPHAQRVYRRHRCRRPSVSSCIINFKSRLFNKGTEERLGQGGIQFVLLQTFSPPGFPHYFRSKVSSIVRCGGILKGALFSRGWYILSHLSAFVPKDVITGFSPNLNRGPLF